MGEKKQQLWELGKHMEKKRKAHGEAIKDLADKRKLTLNQQSGNQDTSF